MSNSDFQLLTPRLVLRDFVDADWSMIYALSREPEVTRYQSWLRLSSEEAVRQWVQNAIDHNRRAPRYAYNLAIVTQADAEAIGWIGWGRAADPTLGDHDFGYALTPSAWGKGYMAEALRAAVTFMFEALGARQVFGECAARNQASARVMEKAGLHLIAQWDERDAETGVDEQHKRYMKRK